jgi:site-specific DNA-methyltransferase (adenine-specific)
MINEVFNEDCMDLMRRYPDNHFSLLIADPPYGIDAAKMQRGNSKIKPDKTKNWDNAAPTAELFAEMFRVSQRQIIWGGNYFVLPPSQYFCIWDKGETMYGRDFAECEYAWVSHGGTRIFKGSPNQNDRIHPTQKSVRLYDFLLHHYAKEGDTILDPFVGSGSSRIAAHRAGLDFVGAELDPDYHAAQEKRYKDFKSQLTLF